MPNVGTYLLQALKKRGVDHIFGVPGDYVLRFNKMTEEHSIYYINATRENTAGYMADAYGRIRGLGAVCITYGVGLNIVNAVSQAYSENSPLIIISGAPGKKEIARSSYLHHRIVKSDPEQNVQLNIFKEITAFQAVLEDPKTAADLIERALDTAYSQKLPVYIELPRDTLLEEITPYKKPLTKQHSYKPPFEQTLEWLKKGKQPLLWVGHEVQRFNLSTPVLHFAEKYELPIVTSLLGKGTFDERHPLVLGVYQGELSKPSLLNALQSVDRTFQLGILLSDLDTGMFTEKLSQLPNKAFNGQELKDFVSSLHNNTSKHLTSIRATLTPKKTPFSIQTVFDYLQNHMQDHYVFVPDVGDALFGGSDLKVAKAGFISNSYFGSLGFSIPGAIGAALASPKKRLIALVGDGAFQMTGTELSTAIRYHLNPIVIVFNNRGYGTERPLIEGSYNDIVNWNYDKLPKLLGKGLGFRVKTLDTFATAFKKALASKTYSIIEVELKKTDFSDAGKRFAALATKIVNARS